MPAPVVVLLIGVAILVLALALYLITIASILAHVHRTLNKIIAAIRDIVQKTEPVNGVVDDINRDVNEVKNALEGLLVRKMSPRRTGARRGG